MTKPLRLASVTYQPRGFWTRLHLALVVLFRHPVRVQLDLPPRRPSGVLRVQAWLTRVYLVGMVRALRVAYIDPHDDEITGLKAEIERLKREGPGAFMSTADVIKLKQAAEKAGVPKVWGRMKAKDDGK